MTNDFPPKTGGIDLFALEMTRRFPPDSVTVVAFGGPDADAGDAEMPWEVVRLPVRTLLPTPRTISAVCELARERGADSVWFASSTPLGFMARKVRHRTGVRRIVATSHGHEVWWARIPGGRQVLRRIGDSVDALTFISKYTRARIAPALSPAARRRMVEVSPGVNPWGSGVGLPAEGEVPRGEELGEASADGGRARARHGLGEGPVVLSVSRLVPRKGQDRLIELWPSVVAVHPEARLVIVGTGSYEETLLEMAEASAASSSIVLTGRLPDADLADLYAAAAVFAMPCRSRLGGLEVEGLGIVFLEAQAAGVPVVVGRSGGAPEAVIDGETGLVVDPGDLGAIRGAVLELLGDPERAARMGAAGRAWVTSSWTWDARYEVLAGLLGRG
ncbi:MAG: glycosyltransferase family 4 protein [Micrococcales bacterium]|nr:glycosyltransferase family 4 protein [Micrococcales bacterium]